MSETTPGNRAGSRDGGRRAVVPDPLSVAADERFRTLANSLPQLVWIADKNGAVTFFNDRRADFSAETRSVDGDGRWAPMIHPEDLEATRSAWKKSLATGSAYEMEHRLKAVEGGFLWHLSRAVPVRSGGEIVAWFGTATDIDSIRRSKSNLLATEERLRIATEAANMFAWEADLKTGGIMWAPNAAHVIGCDPAILASGPESGSFFVAPEERQRLLDEFNRGLRSGSDMVTLEFRGLPRNGEDVEWRAFIRFLRGADGKPERAIGVTQDVTAQKRTEASAATFAERLASAEEGAGALVYDWDLVRGTVWRSASMTRILGWEPHEIAPTAEAWASLMHPDDKSSIEKLSDEDRFTGDDHAVNEYRVRHRDGHYVWLLDSARVFRDAAGKVIRIAGTTIDMTKRREAEESQRRTASLIELSFEPIFAWHPERGIMEWNKGAEQLYGYTKDEALGRSPHELLRTEHPAGLDSIMSELRRNKSWTGELYHIAKDDSLVAVESRHELIETGEDAYVLETNRDIGERKRAEAHTARMAAVAAASHDALYGTTLDGYIEAWNPGAERLFGYTEKEALGQHISLTAGPARRHQQAEFLTRVARGESVGPFETQVVHKEGHMIHVSKAMTPVIAPDGRVLAISIAAHDISDRLEWEERQRLMNRELAHRVKNSFAVLQAILRSTLKSSPDPAHFAQAFSGRLHSLAAAHDVLSANDWRGAELGALLRHQLSIYVTGQRIVLRGMPVHLGAEFAAPISLIVNELATNALKYGALSAATGVIDISWRIDENDEGGRSLQFEWREQGGPPARPPVKSGFGSTLIQKSLAEATVETCFDDRGYACKITWPLPAK
jgi:PAS domain S-box-containing protein